MTRREKSFQAGDAWKRPPGGPRLSCLEIFCKDFTLRRISVQVGGRRGPARPVRKGSPGRLEERPPRPARPHDEQTDSPLDLPVPGEHWQPHADDSTGMIGITDDRLTAISFFPPGVREYCGAEETAWRMRESRKKSQNQMGKKCVGSDSGTDECRFCRCQASKGGRPNAVQRSRIFPRWRNPFQTF